MTRAATALLVAALSSGCAGVSIDGSLARVDELARAHAGASAVLARTDEDRARATAVADGLLDQPLTAEAAVRVAFANSPALQALLADHAAASAAALQGARPANPVLTLERLVRGDVTEIGRMLSIGLTDLLTLPARGRVAETQVEAATLRSAGEVLDLAVATRRAWVNAVAAQQAFAYAGDVRLAAETASELARRMQAAGNFNRLQRAREQAFYADAVTQQARAQHAAVAARERLVRLLGLTPAQAARVRLPERLPELPASPRDETALRSRSYESRLDVALARHALAATARQQGLTRVTSWVDGVHLGVIRNSETGDPVQRGFELEFPLPLFDFGDARRAGAQAAYLAALNRTAQVAVDARSEVAEAYHAYRTAHDIARHYRDEIVPLRQAIAEENLLRYNGMLIGVFELLADARAQIGAVIAAIDAARDFWLADGALEAALVGRPLVASPAMAPAAAAAPAGDAGH
jgi:outer membrane protein TolC